MQVWDPASGTDRPVEGVPLTGRGSAVKTTMVDATGAPINGSNPIPVDASFTGAATPRITASYTKPSDATQYTNGDLLGNSLTAASVTPLIFSLGGVESGRITGARCTVIPTTPDSVIAAFDFDLILFRPETNIPFAAAGYPADNAPLNVTGLMMNQIIGILRFTNSSWRGPLGSIAAGVSNYQAVAPTNRPFFPFNIEGLTNEIRGLLQMTGVWNPGANVYTINFALDVDPD